MNYGTMPALVHKSLADATPILLVVVFAFSIGFLLWFLAGLLREERRMRVRQVHIFRWTGGRVPEFEHRRPKGARAALAVQTTRATREAGNVQVLSAPDERSGTDAVKVRWLIL